MLIFQGVYILDLPFHPGSGFRSQKKVIILVVTGWGVDLNYIWPTESLTDPVHFFGGQCSGKWWSNKFGCSKYELMTLDDPESSYLYSSKKIARWWLIQIKFTFYPSFAQKMCFIWGAYSSTGFQQKTLVYSFIYTIKGVVKPFISTSKMKPGFLHHQPGFTSQSTWSKVEARNGRGSCCWRDKSWRGIQNQPGTSRNQVFNPGGATTFFYFFSQLILGGNDPIWRSDCSNGLKLNHHLVKCFFFCRDSSP